LKDPDTAINACNQPVKVKTDSNNLREILKQK